MEKFKVGDRVICVGNGRVNSSFPHIIGKIGTVLSCPRRGVVEVKFDGINSNFRDNNAFWLDINNFKKATKLDQILG